MPLHHAEREEQPDAGPALAMAFKLIEAAQDRWRAVNKRPHISSRSSAGATFEAGKLVERPDDNHQPEAA